MTEQAHESIRRLVAAAPPLSPGVRVRLAALLRPDAPAGHPQGNKRISKETGGRNGDQVLASP
jgi:hypothetical protein